MENNVRLKPEDRTGVIIIFVLGGLYGLTNGPLTAGSFFGGGLVVMIIALCFGWALNKILADSSRYKNIMGKISKKMSPAIILGIIGSSIILIRGIVEYTLYY